MIRSIRKKHKIIWLILAILLPLLFIAGIVFRHSEPVNENVPKKVQGYGFSRETASEARRFLTPKGVTLNIKI